MAHWATVTSLLLYRKIPYKTWEEFLQLCDRDNKEGVLRYGVSQGQREGNSVTGKTESGINIFITRPMKISYRGRHTVHEVITGNQQRLFWCWTPYHRSHKEYWGCITRTIWRTHEYSVIRNAFKVVSTYTAHP